ncbi:YgaP family membrane protein [Microcella sp.]|uniref:YgaP family membrane protein n=1 Tax=Microcella sp. TaxID=1913979 RepID=UPI00255D65A6|nr:DUF2892 domain-containing protein [Microcella sp.]MBX9471382.1 DUF2892 domain-containing protein [Microcella sp.]
MKTPAPWGIAVLTAVSSPVGRWARIIGGPAIIAGSLLSGGWALALIPVGILMLATGVLNLCPAGFFLGRPVKGDELVLSFTRVDAVSLKR